MLAIPTEVTVIMNGDKAIYAAQTAIIRVMDEAAGPYLAIEGKDDESTEHPHCFYLQSEKEIDEFAAICKKVLREAEHG